MKIVRVELKFQCSPPLGARRSRLRGVRKSLEDKHVEEMRYDPRHQLLEVEWEKGLSSFIPVMAINHMEPAEGESLPAGPGRPRRREVTE